MPQMLCQGRLWALLPLTLALVACPTPAPIDGPSDSAPVTVDGSVTTEAGLVDGAHVDAARADTEATERGLADQANVDTSGQDAQRADAASPCNRAEDCPEGQGCVDGSCQACQSSRDCRLGLREGCHQGVCAPCSDAEDCAAGLACRSVSGECHTCRVASECRAGEACVDGSCGACSSSGQCNGGLCLAGSCAPCSPGSDDATCRVDYADPSVVCQADGRCAPDACTSGNDCRVAGLICGSAGTCVSCSDAPDCLDALSGGYAAGTLCVDGLCVEARCLQDSDCPDDRPICASDYQCRGCQQSGECLSREGVASGYVCELLTGRCSPGDCYPGGVACDSDRVCGDDLFCRDCGADVECRVALSDDSAICLSGACGLGCASGQACGDRQVCDASHRCTSCSDNAACGAAYGANYLCIDSLCQQADCNDEKPCGLGRVCDSTTYVCRDCQDHSECTSTEICDLGNLGGTGRCVSGACSPATQETLCSSGLCSQGACIPCDNTHLCGDSRTGQSRVCDQGACKLGECTPASQDSACGSSTRYCDPSTLRCAACSRHDQCSAGSICFNSNCITGDCVDTPDCGRDPGTSLMQICGGNHVCRACGGDSECQNDYADASMVCQGGLCSAGCNGHPDCTSTNYCVAGRCKTCARDSDCGGGRVCDDANACTVSEACQGGLCQGGMSPCEDGLSCTDNRCTAPSGLPVCTVSLTGGCLIDDGAGAVCYATYDLNPSNDCQRCDPGAAHVDPKTSWTTAPDGTSCGAGGSGWQCLTGVCSKAVGETCTQDADCYGGQCECVDATCSARVCSDSNCQCAYTAANGVNCVGDLNAGLVDPEDDCGTGLACDGAGRCQLGLGATCTQDSRCQSGLCECNNAACTIRVCSDTSCPCEYTTDGVGACDGKVASGTDDAHDSCGAGTCNGTGGCDTANGQPCTSGFQCASMWCECKDAACTSKICSNQWCICRYTSSGTNGCVGDLNKGVDDGGDTCGLLLTCNGYGTCHKAAGVRCGADAECESNQCDCGDATCSSGLRVCSQIKCPPCRFQTGDFASCTGFIDSGADDKDNTCGTLACDGQGDCLQPNGATCAQDYQCASGQCECGEPNCVTSLRKCSQVDCGQCRVNADGNDTCEGFVDHGRDDVNNSCGYLHCNGQGGCTLPTDSACTDDYQCNYFCIDFKCR